MNPAYSHVGTHTAMAYNYMGIPTEITGYKKGKVPSKPNKIGKKAKENGEKENKRAGIPHPNDVKKSNVEKKDKVNFCARLVVPQHENGKKSDSSRSEVVNTFTWDQYESAALLHILLRV